MWWLPPNFSDGAEFEFGCSVLPSIRLMVLLNGLNLSTPTTPPPVRLNEWRCRIVVAWCWLADGLLV